jgi:nitrile hydratase accessory protein
LNAPESEQRVFQAPWQALAFGLALRLHEQGVFTWNEWADTLASVIREAQARGDPDLGDTYYLHWVKALERLMISRGIADEDAIAAIAETLEEEAHHAREAQRG